jgi:multidrug transporter EmrE-like cation transporter
MVREFLMILFVTCSTLGSQLLVKDSVVKIAQRVPVPAGLDWLLAVLLSPKIWLAVAVQGVGFLVWVVVVSRVKLGIAFAISGAFFYILIALLSWQLYGERLAPLQWTGIVLVSAGVVMISMLGYKG